MPLHLTFNGTRIQKNGLTLETPKIWDDWFLPSRSEFVSIHNNLNSTIKENIFINEAVRLNGGTGGPVDKDIIARIKPIRSFNGNEGDYSVNDLGPAGGYIFDFEDGLYYEVSKDDIDGTYEWSNIHNDLAGATGISVGTGLSNSITIVNQIGHINSAAKLCLDYVYSYG
jgi:hypothetical protein